jgi:O-antigen ligase
VSDARSFRRRDEDAAASWSSTLALVVLVVLAVAAPWPFGSVRPWTIELMTVIALGAALVALLDGLRRGLQLADVPVWPLLGFLAVALVQLVPLPGALHTLVAPGSAAVWHPPDALVASVLGPGPFPVSLDPATTARAAALVGGLGLLAVLAAPALARPDAAVAAATSIVVGGVCLAVYAIFARARFGVLLFGSIPVPTIKPFGPFVSKNHFAGYVVLAILVALGLALGLAGRGRGRDGDEAGAPGAALSVVAALAMSLAVLVSLSRGGVVSLACGVAAFAVVRWSLRRGTSRMLVPSLALGAIVAGLLGAVLPGEAQRRIQNLETGSSMRLDTWRASPRMIASSPLVGQGLGAFHDAFPRYKRAGYEQIRVEHAENDYLETLAETGLAGSAFALAGLGMLFARGWRGLRREAQPVVRGLGVGALAALVAVAVHSAFDFNLRIPSNAALAAFAAAAVAAATEVAWERATRALSAVLLVLAALLLVLAARAPDDTAAFARAEVAGAARADTAEVRALRLARADDALRRTLAWRPAHAESWLLLAAVRADRGDAAAAGALARHAVSLDPLRTDLRAAAERLEGGAAAAR